MSVNTSGNNYGFIKVGKNTETHEETLKDLGFETEVRNVLGNDYIYAQVQGFMEPGIDSTITRVITKGKKGNRSQTRKTTEVRAIDWGTAEKYEAGIEALVAGRMAVSYKTPVVLPDSKEAVSGLAVACHLGSSLSCLIMNNPAEKAIRKEPTANQAANATLFNRLKKKQD